MSNTPDPGSNPQPWSWATLIAAVGLAVNWFRGKSKDARDVAGIRQQVEEKLWVRTQEELDKRDARISRLEAKNEALTVRVDELELELDQARTALAQRERALKAAEAALDAATIISTQRAGEILELQRTVNQRTSERDTALEKVAALEERVALLETSL